MNKEVVLVVGPIAVAGVWQKEVSTAAAGFKPWQHQEKMAEFIRGRRGAGIFAEMGTGKTLASLLGLGLVNRPLEFVDISHGVAHARVKRLKNAVAEQEHPLVVFVNHDSVWRKAIAAELIKLQVIAVIVDECHRIKSPSGKCSRWLATTTKFWPKAKRLAMTGTPCPNNPLDLYAQLRYIDHGSMWPVTAYAAFRSRVATTHPEWRSKVLSWNAAGIEWLTGVVKRVAVQVSADEVLKDRPEAVHQTVSVVLSSKVRRFYEELKKDFVAQIDAGEVSVSNAMTLSTRLRQATGGQTAIDGVGRRIDPAVCDKRAVLEDLLSDLDEPVVIFANFVCDMEEIAAACRSIGKSFSELSGRKKELKQWQDGDTDVIGVQIQAGGAGVDLSRSRIAIYYSPTWSLGDYDQSLARIRRPGQKAKSCLYLHLVAANTIDGVMHKALQGKRRVVDAVIEGLASPVTV